ncbi:uncharacterized protein F5891DRAFT_1278754 [Suillus fuscotomentosus]|uniref:Uncharacterized protein n=1 Tax=Suillus fuscotomentosus TaxID=1912939 RepID=A0AAD4E4Q3_9AGAM|nr:uncharacterized protein F5891DRAFT_1278754 [Suillus fuscotomentosus]KAG1899694.1 hypothetical protein F5891DRAFT_1278754 [Suillus fuscotomentosus]
MTQFLGADDFVSAIPPTPTIIVSEPVVRSPTLESTEERLRKELEVNKKDAKYEFSRYEEVGILLEAAERTTDVIRLWEQKEHTIFPLLFHVAMDVLPAQALELHQ